MAWGAGRKERVPGGVCSTADGMCKQGSQAAATLPLSPRLLPEQSACWGSKPQGQRRHLCLDVVVYHLRSWMQQTLVWLMKCAASLTHVDRITNSACIAKACMAPCDPFYAHYELLKSQSVCTHGIPDQL